MPPRRARKHPPLGAHLSVAGGLVKAFAHGAALGCDAAQIFVKNASRWRGRELTDEEAAAFRAAHAASRVGPVLAHASYLINLAAADPVVLERSRAALADELRRCARLGIEGLVVHPGAHLGGGAAAGIARVAASLDAVLGPLLAERPGLATRVLLENTAGQGSCLGCKLDELAAIRAATAYPERVGFCLDTCHAFAAGYAVHEEEGYGEFVGEVVEVLGLAHVGGFHLNDSVRPFASRIDRHAHIGEGRIGVEPFARFLHDRRLRAIPMVLETEPGLGLEGHRRDLEKLRALLAG
ncbi:MAG TPA: deoxyribonuclease IV [Thermoanaerobaculia bacterium]|nr:deoxyribonuclease IV [Thermoanaerobaculia bacterium]